MFTTNGSSILKMWSSVKWIYNRVFKNQSEVWHYKSIILKLCFPSTNLFGGTDQFCHHHQLSISVTRLSRICFQTWGSTGFRRNPWSWASLETALEPQASFMDTTRIEICYFLSDKIQMFRKPEDKLYIAPAEGHDSQRSYYYHT